MSITLMIAVALDIILICIGAHIIFLTHRIKQKVDYKRSKVYSKYKVITLCGSTKFKKEFEQITKELTLKGYIVISVGLFGHCGDNEVWTGNTKRMLDKMHKAKFCSYASVKNERYSFIPCPYSSFGSAAQK